jgi:hypothetical protein
MEKRILGPFNVNAEYEVGDFVVTIHSVTVCEKDSSSDVKMGWVYTGDSEGAK